MKASVMLACTWLLVAAGHVAAQGVGRGGAPISTPGIQIVGVEPIDIAEPVVGAPYSAESETVRIQQLADGNRLEQRATGRVARDARGRIRREQQLVGFGSSIPETSVVTIMWPAERLQYRVDTGRKVAYRLRLPPAPPVPAARPAARSEAVDPIVIDGIHAEGTRTVTIIPTGQIGNDRPIEVVNERWFSPELRVVVQTRRFDPRFGEVLYRLVNISRGDPPVDLFEVPGDFTIEEQRPLSTPARRQTLGQGRQP
jgi:hypothetical protein